MTGKLEKKSKEAVAKTGRKRKFDPLVGEGEQERSLAILNRLEAKRPTVKSLLLNIQYELFDKKQICSLVV